MAAAIAILLYRELPRVAFEAQRNKEALLIERGEQYSRAIQLYVRKWKKYPATMEDLESTNQVRFLRKRYIDPMTGKSEWRIVHVGPGGVFLDSLVNKPPKLEKEEQKSVNTFTYEAPTTGAALQPAQGAPGFTPVRPSERGMRMPGQFPGSRSIPRIRRRSSSRVIRIRTNRAHTIPIRRALIIRISRALTIRTNRAHTIPTSRALIIRISRRLQSEPTRRVQSQSNGRIQQTGRRSECAAAAPARIPSLQAFRASRPA